MSSAISNEKKRNTFSCMVLLLFVFGISFVYSQDPVPFDCDGSAYLVSSPSGTVPATLYVVQANNPTIVNATITPSIPDRYNGIGYNFEDNLIYGFAQGDPPSLNPADVVRIDAEGTVTRFGVPQPTPGQVPGLPTWTADPNVNANGGRVGYAAGVVGLDHKLYTLVATNNNTAFLATVDLTTMTYTTVRLSRDISNIVDLAFSPYNGFLYGIANGQLIRINPNNGNQAIINPSSGTIPAGLAAGGAWNDVQGRIYFYANGTTPNRLYRYNPANNVFVNVSAVDPYPTFDATACFPTRLEKGVSIPAEGLVPGDVAEFEFSIYNNQMLPMTYDFEDILESSDLSWVEGSVEPATPGGGAVSISGQTLTISGVTVQPSAATGEPLTFRISVKVADNASYGSCYSNQATITQGGTEVASDNPDTEEPNDPTLFCLNECELPAPVSSGNIQQCAIDPIQKITAIATVPDGVQIIWYDAPAGGNVVADPSLETVGSVTYYAAADDGTCISQNRTPVTLNLLPTPLLDEIEDVEECVSYELPEITGRSLSGNEAYYTEPNGGGTKYLPGDVIEDIGSATLYVYDEMEAMDNCEGNLTLASNTAYFISDLFPGETHYQYPGTVNSGFWQGTANQQILYNSPGTPAGNQIYLGLVGDVSIDDTAACFGTEVNINAQVTVTNQGPGDGVGYSGMLAIINTNTDQVLYNVNLTTYFPANTTITPTVSGIVPASDVLAGNIAIMMAVETNQQGIYKNWLLSNFSAEYQFQPESTQACSDEQSFELTINDLPELLITDPTPECLPGTVDLTAPEITDGSTPGLIFSYFEDAEATVELNDPEAVSVTGTYYIRGEDPVTGCSTIMPVEAVLIDAPEVSIGQPVCINGEGSIEVTSPLGTEFEYSIDGADYQSAAVFESVAPGTYMVTVRSTITGCVSLETEAVIDDAPAAPVPVVTQPDCESPTGTIHIPRYENALYSIDGGANFSGLNTFSELEPGDYMVVIRADGCDSDPVSVTIEEAPPVPPAPVSGGDQIVCAENPVQTLTATASVEAGETLVWYDAPIGGNVVANPSLSAIGVVTYYAEANNGTCPSFNRTAVTLMIQQAPHLDPVEDQEACEEYILPEIEGIDLSGNEAYFTEPNGGGTRLEPGDTINTIGTTTLYIYDEIEGEFNCSGTLSAVKSTKVTQSGIEGMWFPMLYLTDDHDPEVWNGGSTEISYDTNDPTVNGQTYKTIASDIVFTGEPGCVGSAIRINPKVRITNTGPSVGRAYSGEVAVVNNATNEIIARSQQLLSTPVNDPVDIDFTTAVSIEDLTRGNISVVIIVETYHTENYIKDWVIENFSVDYQYLPEFTPSCPDEESFDVTIYETPTAEAGEEQTLYNGGIFELAATAPAFGTGEWSIVDGSLAGTVSDVNNPNATVELDPNTSVTLRWTVTNGTCSAFDDVVLNYISEADIVTEKVTSEAGQTTYVPGETVEYTITVTNNGPSDAEQVNIVDVDPAGAEIANWTAEVITGAVTLPNTSGTGSVDETIDLLPVDARVMYRVTVQTFPQSVEELVNTVQVTSPTPDPDPDCEFCETPPLNPNPQADIVTVKTTNNVGQTAFVPGTSVEYTITLTNNGPSNAHQVNIVDTAPAGTTIIDWTAEVTAGTVALPNTSGTGDIDETITTLPNGAVVTYTVTVQTPADFTDDLVNAVQVTSPTEDPDPDCPDCITPPLQPASIALVKTGEHTDTNGNSMADAGDEIIYTFTVTNTGKATVTDITIDDALTGTSGLPITPSTLAPGNVGTATVTYTITQEDVNNGGVSNQALATGNTPDGDPVEDESGTGEDNDDPTDTPIVQDPSIALVKTVANTGSGTDGAFVVGDAIEYTFTVTNTGNVTVAGITIDDVLTGTTGLAITPSTLAPGEVGTATATYTITQPDVDNGGVSNQALATGNDPNGDPIEDESGTGEDNDDPTDTPIAQDPSIALVKTVANTGSGADGAFVVGDAIEYTFTVINTGNVTIAGITIDDALTGTTGLAITPSTLAPGEVGTATATYTITQSDVDNGGVSNQALANGTDPNSDPIEDESGTDEDNDDPTDTPITREPSIALVKTVTNTGSGENGAFVVGDAIEYTFMVSNTGNVTVSDITIEDTLTGTSSLSITPAALAPGEMGTATATYTIAQEDVDNGGVSNQALASGTDPNGDPIEDESGTDEDNDNPTDTPITREPSIALVKTVSNTGSGENGAFVVGDAIEYTFTVSNTGNVTITGITIDDDLTGTSGLPITPATIAPGESGTATATYTITQSDVDNGGVSNQALASGTDPNGDPIEDESGTDEDNDNPTETSIEQIPSIALVKTVTNTGSGENGAFVVGDAIEYTFTVSNTGNVTITGITIDDDLTGTSGLPITPATIAPGESGTATATYTITQSDVDNGGVSNQALATGNDPNGDPIEDESGTGEDNDDPTDTPIAQEPSIALIKTVTNTGSGENGAFVLGDAIEYTFTVTNKGNVTVADINIDDALTGASGLPINPPTLAPGDIGTATATYTITQEDVDNGGVSNQALATGNDPNGDPIEDESGTGEDNDDPTDTPIAQDPSIALVKTVTNTGSGADGAFVVGDAIEYTFTVTNTGNVTVADITIDDALTGTSGLPISPATLSPGAIGTATATYTITQSDVDNGGVSNQALATGQDPGGDPTEDESGTGEDNDDPTDTPIAQNPSIALVKTVTNTGSGTDGAFVVGDAIEYTFTVTNTGNVTVADITIDDALTGTSGLPISPATLSPGAIGTATATYTITQSDVDNGGVSNQALATGHDPGGNPIEDESGTGEDNDDPTDTPIAQDPSIVLVKTVTNTGSGADGAFVVGDAIEYTFTVTNTGNVTVADITIDDALTGTTGLAITPSTLAPGEEGAATVTYTIVQADVDNGGVSNRALATGNDPNGDPVEDESGTGEDNDDPTNTPIEQSPSVALVKTGEYTDTNNNDMADAGDEIVYTFTVVNTGNVTVTGITIDDDLTGTTGLAIAPSTLAPGEEGMAAAAYTITQSDVDNGGVSNQALAMGTDPNGDPVEDESGTGEDNDDPTDTPITQTPDMALYKAGTYIDENGDGSVTPGDVIAYSFTVENTGNVTLSNISISDETVVPALEVSPVTPSVLAPGETGTASAVYVITQQDIDLGAVYNIAEASAETPGGEELYDESQPSEPLDPSDPLYLDECPDCTVVELERNPAMTLVKIGEFNDENGDGNAQAGETITYRFKVENTGNVFLSDIRIEDPLPGISMTGGPISLSPGESDDTTFSATYIITQEDIIAGGVTNQATVRGRSTDDSEISSVSDSEDGLGNDPTFTELEGCTIEVFNGLSPNGDGLNDTFKIQGIECYPDNTVEIYNRWGVKVYDTRGYDNSSNVFRGYSEGRITLDKGKRLPSGTYFYILKYRTENGNIQDKSGYLYIN